MSSNLFQHLTPVPQSVVDDNWDKIFGKKQPEHKSKTEQIQDRQSSVEHDLGLDGETE